MAVLTVQSIVEAGLEATYSAAAALGDSYANTGKEFVHVKNGSGVSVTVTCDAAVPSVTVAGYGALTKAGVSVAIPAGENRFIGPLGTVAFGATPLIEYSAATSVTVAAMSV